MFQLLYSTAPGWAGTLARIVLGLVMLPHGAQKLLGLFGGYGFKGTMDFFTGTLHLPYVVGLLVIITEFFGSLSLIIGLGGRFWAVAMAVLLVGIILTSHVSNGFFMNWFGNQAGEGFEFHLLAIGLALVVAVSGSGNWSVDRLLQ
ncbi:MAG: DoxX family protein [Flavobacteriales bacterium]